jgi:hypothetical protein
MRTTVNLDPHVLAALKAIAERERTTLGGVIETLFRQAMSHKSKPLQRSKSGFPLLPNRKRGTLLTAEHVRDLLEKTDIGGELYEGQS